jgi:hypothetical protein
MDIRNLTFQKNGGIEKTKKYSTNRWTKLDDSIYNNLAELVSVEDKEKIADLLNIFYYFIICYSKMCFKKNADWHKEYKVFTHYKNKKKYTMGNTFDYDLANDLNSHTILLKIQKQLYVYRKQYHEIKHTHNPDNIKNESIFQYATTTYFTDDKKQEIIDFINESLYDIVKFITPPVKIISADVQAKLDKYKTIKSKTRPNLNPKYDAEVIKTILGYDANIISRSGTSNMIEVSFHSG